jgi:hypothetical protein
MRSNLAVVAGGLILAAAFGMPAGAQASVSSSAVAHARATAATPALPSRGCGEIWDDGIGKYATTIGTYVEFKPLSYFTNAGTLPPNYCNLTVDNEAGTFEIYDPNTGGCLAEDSANGDVKEDSSTACADEDYWDLWQAKAVGSYHGNTLWQFFNVYEFDCMYDDLQTPATFGFAYYSGCSRHLRAVRLERFQLVRVAV